MTDSEHASPVFQNQLVFEKDKPSKVASDHCVRSVPVTCSRSSPTSSVSSVSSCCSADDPLDIDHVLFGPYSCCSTPVSCKAQCVEAEDWRDVLVCLFGKADSASQEENAFLEQNDE